MSINKNIEQLGKVPFNKKATALWLYENTSLTYKQISNFCQIEEEIVESIADSVIDVPVAEDPIEREITTQENIDYCQNNPNARLEYTRKYLDFMSEVYASGKKGKYKYIPIARRKDKPDAIAWILKNHPYITHATIAKLIRTTISTIDAIKNQTHWNAKNIKVRDPVQLNLCTKEDLDQAILQARTVLERNDMRKKMENIECDFHQTGNGPKSDDCQMNNKQHQN